MVFVLTTYLFLMLSTIQNSVSDVFVYNAANRLVEDFDDQPAKFGPPFPSEGLKGYLMLTNPKNACTAVEPPPKLPIPGYSWIALIPRTKSNDMCDFDLKVLNAESANFSAVIIYNYEDVLIRMSDHGRNVNIPSTLITHYDGLSLITNYLFNASVPNATDSAFFIEIDDEQIFRLGPYLIPLITVISTSFLGLIGFMLIKCCLHRRRNRRHRLPRSALKQLRTKKFTKGDRWDVCAICLDDYEEGAKLRILPCDHAYHMKCIDPWLLNNRRQCPVCKRYVFPNADDSDEENQRRATERTPLLQSNDENSAMILPRNTENERPFADITPDYMTDNLNDYDGTSMTDTDETSDRQRTRVNNTMGNNQFFSHLTSSPEQRGHPQYPRVVFSHSSLEQSDTQEQTRFDSVQESSPTPFTTPRHANFFVGSYGATTDTTNVSAHSIIEHTFGSDVDNPDEDLPFISTDQGTNQGYISDSEATENAQNRL